MKKSRDCEPGQVQHQCLSSQMHISKNGQKIPINTFLNLVENLPRRTEAGITAKGGLASYLTLWIQNRKSLKFICLWVQASRYFWQHSVCALNLWLGQSYGRTAVPHLGQISFGPWSYLETTDSMKTCCFLITSKNPKAPPWRNIINIALWLYTWPDISLQVIIDLRWELGLIRKALE